MAVIEKRTVERLRRELRAITGHADDPEAFAEIEALAAEWAEMRAERARALTTEGDRPYSWAEIARPLSITRQAAWKRYAGTAREDAGS